MEREIAWKYKPRFAPAEPKRERLYTNEDIKKHILGNQQLDNDVYFNQV